MSKFQPRDEYIRNDPYRSLPFRFERLENSDYVLTNLVGEYHILPSDRLQSLISGTLPSNSAEFAALRSKHFVYYQDETSPLELLALKLRSKLSRLANFTNLHIFVVSLRCDHSCSYCQVSRQSEDRAAFDMTTEIAEKGLEFAFRSPNPAIKFEFQGGEPLLNFDLIRYVVTRAKEINLVERRDLEFVIATTLSVITNEMLAFCKEHRILLSTSLDGPEDLHNMNRPRRGRDSYQSMLSGLGRARQQLGYDRVSALMTTTERSLDRVHDIIDEYIRLGFDGIFLRPMSPYGFAVKTKTYHSYDTERWLEFYKSGLSYIIQLNKSGYRFVEHYAAIILEKMLTAGDAGFVDLMSPSGGGIAAIVFNYDGAVYASDESRMLAEMGDTSFRLGHLLQHSYEEIILSDVLLDALESSFTLSVPQCSDCAFEPYCGADPVFHHATQNDLVGRKPESEFCRRNMSLFKHLIHLMREDPEVKSIFLSWANKC